ncbi:MAG: hypothetical protein ACYDEI_00060 [Erysipelotrichaceae bacterium]
MKNKNEKMKRELLDRDDTVKYLTTMLSKCEYIVETILEVIEDDTEKERLHFIENKVKELGEWFDKNRFYE